MLDAFFVLAGLLPDPVLLIDTRATILATNRAFEELVGAAVVGRPLADFCRGDDGRLSALLSSCARSTGRMPGRLAFVTADGTERQLRCVAEKVSATAGEIVVRFIGAPVGDAFALLNERVKTLVDEQVATQRELRASEARFHNLVDAVSDYAIFMLDATGHVATWNVGAQKIKGYLPHEIIGQSFSVFYPSEDRERGKPEEVLARVRAEGRMEEEGWRVRKDGTRFWASVVMTAVRQHDGTLTGFAKVTRDLTARRAAEEQQRKLMREQTARAMSETALAELERANRAKDEFLATMSHELRTPLNALLGWARLLRAGPADSAKLEQGLAVIERNALAQARLVDDLMDVSRIISGKLRLTLKRTMIAAIIRAAGEVVRPAADAKGVALLFDLRPDLGVIVADPDRLQQVIWNLLSNAIRFTPTRGSVTVKAERSASRIIIRVEDTGAGIPADHLPHVFERFRQVDSSITRSHGGLGLGLSIVRHLVEAHGGTVTASSEGAGLGATFTITLPILALLPAGVENTGPSIEVPAGAHALAVAPRTTLEGVRALIVDDDRDSLDLLRVVLEGAGAIVTTAESAQHALEARGRFDIIVSDLGMPEMDGYTFMRTIRARDAHATVPAIALSAFTRPEDAAWAIRAGYQEHIAKPVDAERLLEAVKAWAPRVSKAPPDQSG